MKAAKRRASGRPVSSAAAAARRSQARVPAARPSTSDPAARAAGLEGAGLALLEQGLQLVGVGRIGVGQGHDHGLGVGGDVEDRGAGGQGVLAGDQVDAVVMQDDHGGLEGLGRALAVHQPPLQRRGAGLEAGEVVLEPPSLRHRPQGGAEGEADRASRGGQDQVGRGHQACRRPPGCGRG
jgi:hypothetical protein